MRKLLLVAIIIAIGYVIMHRSNPVARKPDNTQEKGTELRGLLKDLGFKESNGKPANRQ